MEKDVWTLGNYRLFQILRRGNISTIYLGEHVHLGYNVALKMVNSWMATDEHIERFFNEARLHASLRHPHIVRMLDFGVHDKLPFMVLDYAPRGTLQDVMPVHVPLPLSMILPLVRQIASALQYIHDHNLIHRDIKPQNILLGSFNEVWLSDFGIAVILHTHNKEQLHDPIGTALYAAPEQIEGHPVAASDQYALATLVYTWLCGCPPFAGSSLQLCRQHLYCPPPALRDLVGMLPVPVEQVVLKALAKDPTQRFAGVDDFAYALQLAAQEKAFMAPLSSLSRH